MEVALCGFGGLRYLGVTVSGGHGVAAPIVGLLCVGGCESLGFVG